MRNQRLLVQDAWYEVRTAVNNREPLLRRRQAVAIFCRVFGEARRHFTFELRGLVLVEERLSFYIRPTDGLRLPAIMQWVKQTFAVRFNRRAERTGHVWGDRYWSRVMEGEPPDGLSPLTPENPTKPGFSPKTPPDPRLRPAKHPNQAQNRAESPPQTSSTTPSSNGNGRYLSNSQPRRLLKK
jgi:hypothetical protein